MMRYVLWAVGILVALVGVVWLIGWTLPVKHTASGRVRIPKPADSVFALIADVRNYPSWRSEVKKIDVLSEGAAPLRYREHGRDGEIEFEVVSTEPPNSLVVRIVDPKLPFGGRWTYRVLPVPEGAELVITEDGEVYNPIFRFVSRFVMGHTATIERYLSDVERKLASRAS